MTTEYNGPLTKVIFLALPESMICLKAAAEREGLSMTDVLNRALQLYGEVGARAHMGLTTAITPRIFRNY